MLIATWRMCISNIRRVRFESRFGTMMLRIVLTASILCACATNALAHHFRFTAYLTGSAEAPANNSGGLGHVILPLDVDEEIMEVETTFAELTGNVTGAHIHAPTSAVGSGTAESATQ